MVIVLGVWLPLLLILVSTLSAAVVGYGVDPSWARYARGYEWIMLARRIEWPLATVAILGCLALLGVVIAGKRRVWWLIGLAPVMALFLRGFTGGPMRGFAVIDEPQFVSAADAKFLQDGDWVVGIRFNGKDYAYPYAALFCTPVVFQSDHDQRMMLAWSPYANRALACEVTRDLRARNLEIVSMPANALLLYDTRLGQFINGVTGLTARGEKPVGLSTPLAARKMTWGQWREAHPETHVMLASGRAVLKNLPTEPLDPQMPMPPSASIDDPRIAMVASQPPLAFPGEEVTSQPLNIGGEKCPLLLLRDAAGNLCAYDRCLEEDMPTRFALNTDTQRKGLLVDSASETTWNAELRAVEGHFGPQPGANGTTIPGRRLKQFGVEEGLSWRVIKHWYPNLEMVQLPAPDLRRSPAPAPTHAPVTTATPTPTRSRPRR